MVAMRAVSDAGVMFAFFEMADEAGAFGYGNMLSLYDLRMATCTSKAFSSLEVGEMDSVIKDNLFEFSFAL